MDTRRLEAFSDGVLAIIITIMVLELKVPHDASLAALSRLWPVLLSYVLSFVYIGIYWNNHHHMIHVTQRVTGAILWANLHLLFWLSLLPFSTGWMGENQFARWPTVAYGVNLLACALAYFVLERRIIAAEGRDGPLAGRWAVTSRASSPRCSISPGSPPRGYGSLPGGWRSSSWWRCSGWCPTGGSSARSASPANGT